MKALPAILLAVVAASAVRADRPCVVKTELEDLELAKKSCSDCQWQCLTDAICFEIEYDGKTYKKDKLKDWDCGDGKWLERSPGLCVLEAKNGTVLDTQEQNACECATQCHYWGDCGAVYFNFEYIAKEDLATGYCPSPIPLLPSPVAPSPKPPSPVVPSPKPPSPSPKPPSPSPKPPSPSPRPPSPSPRPPSPSPEPSPSPFVGVSISAGFCNATEIFFEASVVVTSVTAYYNTTLSDSDDCCALCKASENCNVMSFCVSAGGCGSGCVNGTWSDYDLAENLIPRATCHPDGRYPRGTCQLLYSEEPLTINVVDAEEDAAQGWVSAVIVPERQPNFPDFPAKALQPYE